MNNVISFGRWVKDRRQARDLTQEALAEQAGCSVDTIRKIESGTRRPSRQIAELLAACLAVPPADRAAFLRWARGVDGDRAPGGAAPAPAADSPAPAPAAPAAPALPVAYLPVCLTSLIGREVEVAQARALLWRVGVRLVTLSGPGGTGKTRLAIELAEALRADFADGVYFVSLAPIQDPALVAGAIAGVLGATEPAGQAPAAAVRAHLRDKALLLVLDNFEHLTTAAPLVTELLEAAPRVKVLVTSRARLQLRGEKEYPVPPLGVPDTQVALEAEQLAQYPAVALFLERAQDAAPGFALTPENVAAAAAICGRLDGLPLAIELAAARCRSLTPRALLAQLSGATAAPALHLLAGGYRDLPARQQTLRATIAWSYDLLTPPQQTLFRRLAVFVGGCTPEAAEQVCGDGLPAAGADLEALADGSLLARTTSVGDEPRFTMLETIREFARERLTASGELDAVARRHADHFVDLAEAKRAELRGPQQATWFARWEREHDNVRGALAWALARQDVALLLRLCIAFWRFWFGHGHVIEGRRWIEAALDLAGEPAGAPAALHAGALSAAGTLARMQGDFPQAGAYLTASVALYREAGDRAGSANALTNLGTLAHYQGDSTRARAYLEESLLVFRDLRDREAIADVLSNLGVVCKDEGDYARAGAFHEESLAIRRALGDKWGVAVSLHNLADVADRQGDYARARALQEEGLALFQAVGDRSGIAVAYNNLGNLALRAHDLPRAIRLQQESSKLFQELGDKRSLIWCVDSLAGIAAALGQWDGTVRLVAAATAGRAAIGVPTHAREQAAYDDLLAGARAGLPAPAVDAAWAAGAALSLDEALATISNTTLTLL